MQINRDLVNEIRRGLKRSIDETRSQMRNNAYRIGRLAYENHDLKNKIKELSRQLSALDKDNKEKQQKLVATKTELRNAMMDLVCCPIFTGDALEKDKESHRAWTLAREVLGRKA